MLVIFYIRKCKREMKIRKHVIIGKRILQIIQKTVIIRYISRIGLYALILDGAKHKEIM